MIESAFERLVEVAVVLTLIFIVAVPVAVGVHEARKEYVLTVESAVGVTPGSYRLDSWFQIEGGIHCKTTDGRTIVVNSGIYRITDATDE